MADPYFSELKYLGGPSLDFIEVAVDSGTDVSGLVITIYNAGGSIRTTNTLAGITPTTIAGKDVYVIDTTSSGTFNGLGKTNAVSLSEGSTVYSFNSFTDNAAAVTANTGPANGMTSTEIGEAGAGDSLISDDGGATYTVETDPNPGAVPCLTEGTLVSTDRGDVAVEQLTPGDMIKTLDGPARPLLQIIRCQFKTRDLRSNPKLYPVRIGAGSLGQGLPKRDLLVSRQHRMLVASPIVEKMFNVDEVLVAANKLVGLPGIAIDTGVSSVTYFHIIFEKHEIFFAEGAPTESLLLGTEVLKSLPGAALEELEAIFPDILQQALPDSACLIPNNSLQKKLIARHARNAKDLLTLSTHA